jgi:hypothetical protein
MGVKIEVDEPFGFSLVVSVVTVLVAGYTVGAVTAGANPTDYLLLLSALLGSLVAVKEARLPQ